MCLYVYVAIVCASQTPARTHSGAHVFISCLAPQVNLGCVIECGRMIARLGLDSKFAPDTEAFIDSLDGALVLSLAGFKRSGMSSEHWWRVFKPVAQLVADAKLVEVVFQSIRDGAILSVSTELATLCASAKIGEKLFAAYAPSIVGARMENYIQSKLEALPVKLTAAAWHLVVRECLEEGESNRAGQHLFKKREVLVTYRSAKVSVSVTSFGEEVQVRTAAWLKSKALSSGVLAELGMEKGLFADAALGTNMEIPEELLTDFRNARATLEGFVRDLANDGVVLMPVLSAKSQAPHGITTRIFVVVVSSGMGIG